MNCKSILLALVAATVSLPAQSRAADPAPHTRITELEYVGYWVRDIEKVRAFYIKYLGFEETYDLLFPTGGLQLIVLKVNEDQCLIFFPNPAKILPNGDNQDHFGLVDDNSLALTKELVAKGVKAPPPHRARLGDTTFTIKDPDGRAYEITQFEPDGQLLLHRGKNLPSSRISARLLTATVMVSNLDASLAFYVGKVGFREVARYGAGDSLEVELKVPDGDGSGITLKPFTVVAGQPAPHAVPDYTLAVRDVAKAVEILNHRADIGGFPKPSPITVGLNGKRQTSLIDPDGTKVILMEVKP